MKSILKRLVYLLESVVAFLYTFCGSFASSSPSSNIIFLFSFHCDHLTGLLCAVKRFSSQSVAAQWAAPFTQSTQSQLVSQRASSSLAAITSRRSQVGLAQHRTIAGKLQQAGQEAHRRFKYFIIVINHIEQKRVTHESFRMQRAGGCLAKRRDESRSIF